MARTTHTTIIAIFPNISTSDSQQVGNVPNKSVAVVINKKKNRNQQILEPKIESLLKTSLLKIAHPINFILPSQEAKKKE